MLTVMKMEIQLPKSKKVRPKKRKLILYYKQNLLSKNLLRRPI